MTRFALIALAAGFAVAAASAAQDTPPARVPDFSQDAQGQVVNSLDTVEMGYAQLRALDTLNGVTQDITLRVGDTTRYGFLEMTLDACRVPRETPESDAYAFLRIRDMRDTEPGFSGWMFASSPALSALDHPRYDVWVLSCSNS